AVRGFGLVEGQRYQDPNMEVGLSVADTSFLTAAGGLTVSAAYVASSHMRFTAALEGRFEHFDETDHLDPGSVGPSGQRLSGAISPAAEIVLGDEAALVVAPAVRLDALSTRGSGPPSPVVDRMPPADRDDLFVSPRIGARWRITDAVTLKGNLGRTFR